MREIKRLTPVSAGDDAITARKSGLRSKSGARSRLFASSLAVAVLAGTAFGSLFYYARSLQTRWDVGQLVQEAAAQLNHLPPSQLLDIWDSMSSEEGLPDWQEAETTRYNKQGRILERISYGIGAVALIGLLGILTSLFLK